MPNSNPQTKNTMNLKTASKLYTSFLKTLKKSFIKRNIEIDILSIGLIIQKNVAFIGSPGEAKSALVEAFASCLSLPTFSYQLNAHTTPDELLGHFSLKEMKDNDQFIRKTQGKLPDCKIAYLDEYGNASGATSKAIQLALNEKQVDLGNGSRIKIPLEMAIGSTNEDVSKVKDLAAFWDRWCLRRVTEPTLNCVNDRELDSFIAGAFKEVPTIGRVPQGTKIDFKVVEFFRANLFKVDLSPVLDKFKKLIRFLKQQKKQISSRRMTWCLQAIAASSLIQGRMVAQSSDLKVLAEMLWIHPEDRELIVAKIKELSVSVLDDVKRLYDIAKSKTLDLQKLNQQSSDLSLSVPQRMEAMQKFTSEFQTLSALIDSELPKLESAIKDPDEEFLFWAKKIQNLKTLTV